MEKKQRQEYINRRNRAKAIVKVEKKRILKRNKGYRTDKKKFWSKIKATRKKV